MNDGTTDGNTVPDIGTRLELFVDRYLIDRMHGLSLRMHEPQKRPLSGTPPMGGYMTVIRDGEVYHSYFRGDDPSYTGRRNYSGHPGETTCYAESKNGQEWITPRLGLFEVNGTRDNNVILAGQPPFSHNFSPFLDTRSSVSEDERYKALAGHPGHNRTVEADGLHSFVSADGIRWKRTSTDPVIPYDMSWAHAFDSQNVSFWSETENRYVCYFRVYENDAARLRSVFRTTSADFRTWDTPVATRPNLPGEHLYTSQTHPYFRATHMYVALPTRYIAGRVGDQQTDPMKGSTDILFMSSRAGTSHYDRLFTEAFIRPGIEPKAWENRANYVAQGVVPTGPAEMSIYHCRNKHRYVLRTDGFISVRAAADEGEFVTKPFVFGGDTLVLNYSSSAAGALRVEVQDAAGSPLPDFGLSNCLEIVGDQIDRVVLWSGEPSLGAIAGRPVRLRFVMKECDLYSLRFRKTE